jgi:hypothetical protein
MLNRSDLFSQLQTLMVHAGQSKPAIEGAWQAWQELIEQSDDLRPRMSSKQWPFPVPQWFEKPNVAHQVQPFKADYGVVGVDGSQIYPDRFYSNLDCFVINTGGLAMAYQQPKSEVMFFSQPYVYTLRDAIKRYGYDMSGSKDLIDLIREEFEFKDGLDAALKFRASHRQLPFLCLFDGSFVFWHLEGKPTEVRELFLSTYMLYLRRFQEQKISVASYISLPRNRELCNAVRIVMCERFLAQQVFCFADQVCACKILNEITDVDLVSRFLQPGMRTGIFMSKSSIADYYFDELRPCFFFLHVGEEIGRVELPWWMAKDEDQVDFVAQVVMDQANKGLGYPVVLAEAHEQAVVKHHDKMFFYEILEKLCSQQQIGKTIALKNIRKRSMPI